MKTCAKCGIEKTESDFYKLPHTRDGLNYRCIPCQNAYNKEYNYQRAISQIDPILLSTFHLAQPERLIRFCRKIQRSNGCWEWVGNRHPKSGYGRGWLKKDMDRLAHRLSYEWSIGPIPDGLTIDHLCRNKRCVNPDHLEPVTLAENLARSNRDAPRRKGKKYPKRLASA